MPAAREEALICDSDSQSVDTIIIAKLWLCVVSLVWLCVMLLVWLLLNRAVDIQASQANVSTYANDLK